MTTTTVSASQKAFQALSPDTVIGVVEDALNCRCSNLCRPMSSYINRVYELVCHDNTGLIVKFYRPGRWSGKALQDEHDFLLELAQDEIPVVAPLKLASGATLGVYHGMYFAVFPKKGGRSFDEYNEEQWLELGRLIGRVHMVGERRSPVDRIRMTPDSSTRDQVNYLLNGDFIPAELAGNFRQQSDELIRIISPFFADVEMIRIHGDCHFGNLIHRPGESFYIIDFDDMAVGNPVQDLWMLLPGYVEDSYLEIDFFLEGYETFRKFDQRTLKLIEPLRAMRYIHFLAWCAHQVADDGASPVAPDFGTREYWQIEINDLADQVERIKEKTGEGNSR